MAKIITMMTKATHWWVNDCVLDASGVALDMDLLLRAEQPGRFDQ